MSATKPTDLPAACASYGSSPYYEYPYLPSLAPGIAFTIIFSLITMTQAFYMFRYRAWWMFFLVAGAGLEVLGWVGRIASHYCAYSNTLSTMQVSTLIMGPGWTQAGVYCAMWVMIQIIGTGVSPIRPTLYLWVCVIVDTICLSLQAIGGGIAGSAASDYEDPQTGTTIMVVGIIAQLVCGIAFFTFLSMIYWRGRREILANKRVALCAGAIAFSTTMMNLRGFYRSVELVQGWTGYLISHEGYLIGLDAVPMVLAMGMLAILSPGPLLAKQRRQQLAEKNAEEVDVEDQNVMSDSERTLADEEVATKQEDQVLPSIDSHSRI